MHILILKKKFKIWKLLFKILNLICKVQRLELKEIDITFIERDHK